MSFIFKILEKSGLYVARASNVKEGEAAPKEVIVTTTRVVSLRELVGPTHPIVEGPKGFRATPEEVFVAAKLVPPANGWSAERLFEVASKPIYKDMPPEARQKAILAELAMQGADPEAIIADALKKDQALDGYQRFLEARLATTRKESEERKKKLEAELAAVAGAAKATETEFEAWRKAKQAKEAQLAAALEPLMMGGKISQS